MKEKTKRPLDISDLLIETCFGLLAATEKRAANPFRFAEHAGRTEEVNPTISSKKRMLYIDTSCCPPSMS